MLTMVPGSATQLVFVTQPGGTVGEGAAFTQPKVNVEDQFGNVVTTSSAPVTLGVNNYVAGNGGSAQGSISGCTNPVNASSGVATFSGCTITGTTAAGTYTLQASSGTLTTAVATSNVTITASSATKLVFTTQPGGTVGEGVAFSQPAVKVEDTNGNVVMSPAVSVTLGINSYTTGGGGTTKGTLNCRPTRSRPPTEWPPSQAAISPARRRLAPRAPGHRRRPRSGHRGQQRRHHRQLDGRLPLHRHHHLAADGWNRILGHGHGQGLQRQRRQQLVGLRPIWALLRDLHSRGSRLPGTRRP